MKIIALIITISFFVTSQASAINLNEKTKLRAPLIGKDQSRLKSALISKIIDGLPVFTDKWQALEQVKSLKIDPDTADLFNNRGYSTMMEVLSVAGKLPKDKLQQAQWLASAYDFYLKEDIKPLIDKLNAITDEWDALEQVKSLKTDSITASLFNNWNYSSMMEVLSVAGKLPKDKLQQAQWLAGSYDFYLKEDIKPVLDKLDAITDEWDALEQVKSLKTDPATAGLFNNWSYGSMMVVLSVAGKLSKDNLQQAQRLASAYDFYLKEDIKPLLDKLNAITDEWDALEQVKFLKTDSATAGLFKDLSYSSMTKALSAAGKLSKDNLQQAQRLASAYDFYLKEDIKPVLDKLNTLTNEWDVLEQVKSLKTDPATAGLFKDLSYSSMTRVLSAAGKLPKDKLPQAQRLAGAYDFYLKEDIKPVLDKLNAITDEWDALEQVKFLKTDSAIAGLFNDWSYSSMMRVLIVAGKLPKDKLPQAQRLAGAYDFYLKEDIKPVLDKLNAITDEWDALEQVKSLKTDSAIAGLFNDWSYSSMMRVLIVAGKLSKDNLQKSNRIGSAADYFLKRKEIITNLLVKTYQDLNDENKRALLEDLKIWDHKSRTNLRKFNGLRVFMRLLLESERAKLFPYLEDMTKPIAEQRFLAKGTRKSYLIVILSLINYEEFVTLISSSTPSSVTTENGILNALKKEPAMAL